MTDLAKLVVRLEAQTAQYMAELEKANKRLSRFDKEANVSAARIAKGTAAAVVGAATGFTLMAKAAVDAADDMYKLSQSTGISTESLSQLKYVADLSGVSIEEVANGLRKLQKTQADAARGMKTAAEGFKAIGVSATNADGSLKDSEQLMLEVADRFSQIEDGAAKAAVAQELFGRSGVKLIPFLNQGRAGIEALREEADRFGLTITTKAGRAAEVFNDNLSRAGAIVKGLANQAAEQLLPTFTLMTEKFIESAKSGVALELSMKALSGAIKTLITGGVIVTSIFEQLGRIIYGVSAALFNVVRGDFDLAAQELEDAFADARSNVTDDMETIQQVWSGAATSFAETAEDIDSAVRETIIFDDTAASEQAKKAVEAAIKELRNFDAQLRQQIETWGLAEDAIVRYRLEHGDLAEAIRAAGPEAEAYADSIMRQAEALQLLNDQAVAEKELTEIMESERQTGIELTDRMRTATEKYADEVERVNYLLERGVITQETHDRAVKAAELALEEANKKQNKFIEEANRNVQDILAFGIETALSDGVKKGAKGALDAFVDMLNKMAIQAIAARLATKIFGEEGMGSGGGMSGGGGWLGTILKFFSPESRDSGGRGQPGVPYLIGTGAQPEMFVPDQAGHFIPAGAYAGGGVTQNIYVQGQVDQRSARQLELEASRRQRVATMRLG